MITFYLTTIDNRSSVNFEYVQAVLQSVKGLGVLLAGTRHSHSFLRFSIQYEMNGLFRITIHGVLESDVARISKRVVKSRSNTYFYNGYVPNQGLVVAICVSYGDTHPV